MKSLTRLLLAAPLMASLGATLYAQVPAAPLTNAQLRAKVVALEQELIGLRNDNTILITACANAQAQPPTAAPAVADQAEEQIARAKARLEQVKLETFNRQEQQRQQQELDDASWIVRDVGFGVTEANQVFIRFGWKVTIKNGLDRTQAFDLAVQFLDGNGLVVDTARVYGATINAFDERTITESELISMPGAQRVASVKAIATRKSR